MLFSTLLVFLTIAWFIFVICIVDTFMSYKKFSKERAYISFNLFKSLYAINPEKWTLGDNIVWYCNSSVCFINYFDYIRYCRWYKKKLKNDKKRKKYNKTATLVEYWKKDIQKHREKSEAELKRSLKEMKEFIKND